jgi:glycosyl transferase family 4
MDERRVLCGSTAGPGGIHDYILAMQRTPLWHDWNIRFIATHRIGSQAGKILVFARATVLFAARLIRSRPDLAHLHTVAKTGSLSRNAILAWMSRRARVPVILHVHSSTFDAFYDNSPPLVQCLIPRTLNSVDAVVALNEASAHVLRVIAPDARVVVIPDAAQLDALYGEVSGR